MDEASDAALSALFVGTATTVIRCAGFTVLTDPNFLHRGQRAYLGFGLSAVRRTEPALSVGELPALDAVVLSHLHGDHWDRVSRRGLDRSVPIVTTPHASRRLQGWHGFRRALGLRTWEDHTLAKDGATLTVTALPARHAPGVARRVLPPVMGSMLRFRSATGGEQRVYLSGDTLLFEGVREIPGRFPTVDLGVLHLGGTTLPGGLVVTLDGVGGADLLELVGPRLALPVHYDDYDVFRSPLSDFRAEIDRRGLGERVSYLQRGQTLTLQPTRR